MKPKKYDSKVCFQGKRVSDIRNLLEQIFDNSIICIDVDHHNMNFIIRMSENINLERAMRFQAEHKQCKIILCKETPLAFSPLPHVRKVS